MARSDAPTVAWYGSLIGGERLTEAADGPLRGLVGGHPRAADAAAERGDLDDPAAALLAQDRQGRLGDVDRAEEVRLDLPSEGLERRVLERHAVTLTRIVDHDGEPAEGGRSVSDGGLRGSRIGDVEGLDAHAVTVGRGEVVQGAGIPGGGDHPVAVGERLLDDLAAAAPRGTRDGWSWVRRAGSRPAGRPAGRA
jgi:hypothetical protein